MSEVPYAMKICQLEKAKGELRALVSLWYESSQEHGGETYSEINPMVEKFIENLSDYCG